MQERNPRESLTRDTQTAKMGSEYLLTAKRAMVALVLALSLLWPAAATSQNVWTNHSPEGGTITALAIDPQTPATVYAGTQVGGVFKSIDGGARWQAVNTGLVDVSLIAAARLSGQPRANINALAIDPLTPANVYAAIGAGVFKSTDGGGSWRALTIEKGVFVSLTIDPRTSTTLYVSSWTTGHVLKSTDGGATWRPVSTGLPSGFVAQALAIDPQAPSTVYAAIGAGVFKSTDGGDNWHASNTGLPSLHPTSLVIDPQTPTTIYMGATGWPTSPGGVFKSVDGGEHWSAAGNTGLTPDVRILAIDSRTPTTLFAVAGIGWSPLAPAGLFKSTDGGESWRSISAGLTPRAVNSLVVDPQTPSTLYAGNSIGVFKSADGGGSWRAFNAGLSKLDLRPVTLATDPQTPTTVYVSASHAVYKSTDGGGSWRPVGISLDTALGWSVSVLAVDPKTPTTIYAGTNGAGVFKSTDGGTGWRSTSAGLSKLEVEALVIDPQTPTTVYAGTKVRVDVRGLPFEEDPSGVFKSTDGGVSWVAINTGLPVGKHVLALAINPQSPTTVYASLSQKPDRLSWPLPTSTGDGVYKTTNGGNTWNRVGQSSNIYVVLAVDPRTPDIIYASGFTFVPLQEPGSTGSLGVFKSVDGGRSWRLINTGLTNLHANVVAVDPKIPTTVYLGTREYAFEVLPEPGQAHGGVFKSTDGGNTWQAINAGLTDFSILALVIDPKTPSTIYATTRDGVFVLRQ